MTFFRMRVPDGLNPRLTAPTYRFLDASQSEQPDGLRYQ